MNDSLRDSFEAETSTPMSELDNDVVATPTRLPWGAMRDRGPYPESVQISTNAKPGEFVLQTMYAEFGVIAAKKIEQVLEPANKDKPLSRSLQRGEDPNFDQLLSSLASVAENTLPSLLRALFEWYDRQNPYDDLGNLVHKYSTKTKGEKEYLFEKRDLAVDFLYCLVLIEVLKQLPYHPGHDDLVNTIISQAFRHFKYKDGTQFSPNAGNMNIVADLYAEVIGVMGQSRFMAVRKRFMSELKELRAKDQNLGGHSSSIISLLMGIKFFRVKMHPIEEFQACIEFLDELGTFFLEVRDKEVKNAMARIFVEILIPVAAVINNEVNIPVLKNFVDKMYLTTLDLLNKKKHTMQLFPMVTCLLCVSQKQFFLNNWPSFLTMCLGKLRGEPKLARIALESLYRLLWVYMIRIKCESNTMTQSRLQSIINSLFPKQAKTIIVPKDAPLSIFVKIIQFIAQERLDFAMKEIIFDLLCVGKSQKSYQSPERMCIGLRAFLVIADSLQQKEGEPPMPQTMAVLPSGNTLRFKKTFINKHLSEETAKSLGMQGYYSHVRKAFNSILSYLDSQVGRPMLMVKTENINREPDSIITVGMKPRIDLFRICIAAIPRLLPDGMSKQELIEMLARLTVHMDDELGKLAFQSLQNILVDLPEWRNDVFHGFVHFIQKEVGDTFPQLLDQCHRRLASLLTQWKSVAGQNQKDKEKAERGIHDKNEKNEVNAERSSVASRQALTLEQCNNRVTLHSIEGMALVMLCSNKPVIRKLAVMLLKEIRNLFNALNVPKTSGEPCVLDMMDKSCPVIVERVLPHLPGIEKATSAMISGSPVDFQWLTERTCIVWASGPYNTLGDYTGNENNNAGGICDLSSTFDPWMECISIFMHPSYVMGHCQVAVGHAWPMLFTRLKGLDIDPLNVLNRGQGSVILRGSKRFPTDSEHLANMTLWKNYVIMGACMAPPSHIADGRSASPEPASSPEDQGMSFRPISPGMTARELYKHLVPIIRSEVAEIRETVVQGLGHINPAAFRDLVEELSTLMKEAIDRRSENVKRRRKRDLLRLALVRIFQLMARGGIFTQRYNQADVIDPLTDSLCSTFVEYIEGARLFFENEADKDTEILSDIRLHFSEFIRHMIRNTPVSKRHKFLSQDLRAGLCELFASWSGRFGLAYNYDKKYPRSTRSGQPTELELSALQAMAAVLCCGSAYDPSGLNDNGYIYAWLDTLLGNIDEKIRAQIYKLAQETIVLLLEFNSDAQTLLDWVIDRCYTGSHEVADGCFNALATVFTNREYPCDHVAMLNVTLLYTGCPRAPVRETAIQLLHLLYKRFFLDDIYTLGTDLSEDDEIREDDGDNVFRRSTLQAEKQVLQELLLAGPCSRSQIVLSETLARLHPDNTMPMFSEITQRFQTATTPNRQTMLQYLLPWLHNMEFLDVNLHVTPPPFVKDPFTDYCKPPLKGVGWGSALATEMVLNNLFYITAKCGDEHAKEIEELWASLVMCWPGNLPVIIRYLVILTGMAPQLILPHAKRVVMYVARARPERLVDEMMNELRTTEPLTFNVERTQTPPYYRLSLKKQQPASLAEEGTGEGASAMPLYDKGTIHTKRHSADEPAKMGIVLDVSPRTSSTTSLRSEGSINGGMSSRTTDVVEDDQSIQSSLRTATIEPATPLMEDPIPFPLPMPAFGGYFAPLSMMLPDSGLPNPPYQRCNLAVMLLTDLVVDCVDIDWVVHLPLMLHIIFLGLDHNSRPLIHEHCKQLLLNLLLVLSAHNDHFSVAKMVISNKTINDNTSLTLPSSVDKDYNFLEGSCESSSSVTPAADAQTTESVSDLLDVDKYETTEQVAKALIEFLITRKCRPLWSYEDITSKVHNIKSAEELEHFLAYVLRVFRDSVPHAHLERRWAQEALHLALACSSRHYAGRSFQMFRALHIPVNSIDLSEILSRLVETVAEQGEDMQGYVTEIMLTLEAAVDNLDVDMKPLCKDQFLSTPNLNKEPELRLKKSNTITPLRHSMSPYSSLVSHFRTTSCQVQSVTRRTPLSSPMLLDNKVMADGTISVEMRHTRHQSGDTDTRRSTNLSRSRSAQSLKHLQDPMVQDDKLTILSQMFWIAVSLLESDFDHEFAMAVRLLDKVLKHLQPDRPECKEKLDKILQQINWREFPGVQALLLKGCTSPTTYESTVQLLMKLTNCITAPVVDPGQCEGFPMNVIALLPYLVEHYEDPSQLCSEAADSISNMCQEQSSKLDNLATVMNLYSRNTFAKDSFQWTKCVVKYLYDVYSMSDAMIAFLAEILEMPVKEKMFTTQGSVLKILHCVLHYIDVTTSPSQAVNADLLRVVTKYIESHHWREALAILKLCVGRSSTLSAPPASMNTSSVTTHFTPFAAPDPLIKKELPGRTMDFSFDQSQLPLIGNRSSGEKDTDKEKAAAAGAAHERRPGDSSSLSPRPSVNETSCVSGWRKPLLSQGRVRDRLVNLLNCYGPRIPMPKSPSVIFSQDSPSGTLERQESVQGSSSEEASVVDVDNMGTNYSDEMKRAAESSTEEIRIQMVARVFDFLDDTDQDSEMGLFGVPSSYLMDSNERPDKADQGDSSDDETHSVSPDDLQQGLAPCPTITVQNPTLDAAKQGSISGSTHSIHSASSDLDLTGGTDMDFSPSNMSPSMGQVVFQATPIDDVQESWRTHVYHVMRDHSGVDAVNTFQLFPVLFQDTKSKLFGITKDALSFMTRPENIQSLAEQISHMLDLMTEVECPLVFADLDALVTSSMVDRHNFSLLEINECFETYLMRREQAVECLEHMRGSVFEKQMSLSDSALEGPSLENKTKLCHCIYRLHFQLLQLFDLYSKLTSALSLMTRQAQVQDISREVVELRGELQRATLELESGRDLSPFQLDLTSVGQSDAERLLVECVQTRDYQKGLSYMRQFRQLFPGEIVTTQGTSDVEHLIYLSCLNRSQQNPGLVVICQPEHDLSEVCSRLMEVRVQVSSAIAQIELASRPPDPPRSPDQVIIRASDSSAL